MKVDHEFFLTGEGLSLTGGELILAVTRIYSGSFGSNPDLARLNLLLFLIEGDGGIASNLLYANTPYGPKSSYIESFISENPELAKKRAYGKKAANSRLDPDVRRKVELTPEGTKIAERAISSLSARGRLIGMVFSMQSLGLLAGPLISLGLIYSGMNLSLVWKLLLAFGAIPALIVIYYRRTLPSLSMSLPNISAPITAERSAVESRSDV